MFLVNLLNNVNNKKCTKTLFLVDILYMKDINAVYGFKNGDKVIKQLKNLLKTLIKNKISPQIYKSLNKKVLINLEKQHSDVFALTFFEDLNESLLLEIKDLILHEVQSHKYNIKNPNMQININITIGCSKSNDKRLVIFAEKALHNAKLNYESYMYYDPNLFINESLNHNLVNIIKYNIDENLVEPYFQAIYDNNTNIIYKYEALMRLFDKDGNMLLPHTFLKKSKKYRLYDTLMVMMINKVFDIIEKHSLSVSINLEYNDIVNPIINNAIISRVEKNNSGKYLTIEILESEKINNFVIINEFIDKIKEYDVKIAIDDFGTGFSNYDYILKLNVDYIKIDGSLIEKIDEEIYINLIKSIVGFCKKQDIKLIAEFVSDLKKFRYVKSLGIDYSQGYYIQKPVPISAITER